MYPSETDIFGQTASLAPFVKNVSLSFLWSSLPTSQHLDTFGMERGDEALFHPSHSTVPQGGGLGRFCDLVSHMIETHLIRLGINIL